MNWTKVGLAGLAAGVVVNIYDFLMHGIVLGDTYASLPEVFSQEQANPLYFFLISVCFWLAASILFEKTRMSWADSFKGGATFGFFMALPGFFTVFYNALVIEGWPYSLCWSWGLIGVTGGILGGGILGLIQRRP